MNWYKKQLKNPKWQKKRLEILNRDNWTCTLCSNSKEELHVHHEQYNGKPWETDNKHLKTLCFRCHEVVEIFHNAFPEKTIIEGVMLQTGKNAMAFNTYDETSVFSWDEDGRPFLHISFPKNGALINQLKDFNAKINDYK